MNDSNDLLMPSDLKAAPGKAGGTPAVEPPSLKLIVRLFVIPMFIVGAAVGIMMLIAMLAGSSSSFEDALQRFKNPGGERTADWLIGPGSKQRYLDAKTLVDQMKTGLDEPARVRLAGELRDILTRSHAHG